MSTPWRESPSGVWCIDVFHPSEGQTCCYLLVEKDAGAIIDCGGKNGIGGIKEAVVAAGLKPEDIQWIIPTHAHLDHAAAAGELMSFFPRATLGGHESTVKHLCNPQKRLVPAVRGLYGEQFYNSQYGELLAVPESRTRSLSEGDTITVGTRSLEILYTPGHAWHHISVYDRERGMFFAGDAYGVSFADVRADNVFIPPVMPPSQFNPDAAKTTLSRLKNIDASYAALAHFGIVDNAPEFADFQISTLDEWESKARSLVGENDFHSQFTQYLREWYKKAAPGADEEVFLRRHGGDIHLNACGFAHLCKQPFPAPHR